MNEAGKILVYGYGNPGRQDDGLGAAFIEKLDGWLLENPNANIETDCNYQLNIEDADAIADKQCVVFVDATQAENVSHFSFTKVEASDARVEFSMHAVSSAFVLDLCKKIYHQSPEAYLLHIKGIEWDFTESLTAQARENLEMAFGFFIRFLTESTYICNENILNHKPNQTHKQWI